MWQLMLLCTVLPVKRTARKLVPAERTLCAGKTELVPAKPTLL